jgi:hypothetical protein
MKVLWPVLLGGIGSAVLGTAILVNRDRVARFMAETQRATFGDAMKRVQRASTGRNMIAPALMGIAIGVAAVVLALVAPDSF